MRQMKLQNECMNYLSCHMTNSLMQPHQPVFPNRMYGADQQYRHPIREASLDIRTSRQIRLQPDASWSRSVSSSSSSALTQLYLKLNSSSILHPCPCLSQLLRSTSVVPTECDNLRSSAPLVYCEHSQCDVLIAGCDYVYPPATPPPQSHSQNGAHSQQVRLESSPGWQAMASQNPSTRGCS